MPVPTIGSSVNSLQIWEFISAHIWLFGITSLLIYSLVSLVRLRIKLKNAIFDNGNVYVCDKISTPFVMGLISPIIYMPATLSKEEKINLFEKGNQTGLEGKIMESVCREILSLKHGTVFPIIEYDKAQDWYDAIKDSIKF